MLLSKSECSVFVLVLLLILYIHANTSCYCVAVGHHQTQTADEFYTKHQIYIAIIIGMIGVTVAV